MSPAVAVAEPGMGRVLANGRPFKERRYSGGGAENASAISMPARRQGLRPESMRRQPAAAAFAIPATSSRRPISPILIGSYPRHLLVRRRLRPVTRQEKSGALWGAPDHSNLTLRRL